MPAVGALLNRVIFWLPDVEIENGQILIHIAFIIWKIDLNRIVEHLYIVISENRLRRACELRDGYRCELPIFREYERVDVAGLAGVALLTSLGAQ